MANFISNLKDKQRHWNSGANISRPKSGNLGSHGDLEINRNKYGDIVVKDNTPMSEQREKKQWLVNNLGANKIKENPVMILRDKSKIKE